MRTISQKIASDFLAIGWLLAQIRLPKPLDFEVAFHKQQF
jgi:hypothetical protein